MGVGNSCFTIKSTTGTAIAIGTGGIQFAGVYRNSDVAGTVILKNGAAVMLTMSADRSIMLGVPVALAGPVTMTSSGGLSFTIIYRDA